MKHHKGYFLLAIGLSFLSGLPVNGQVSNISYPKEIIASTGEIITVYQPQPENLTGNKITGRSALSIRKNKDAEPVFGAVFYEATISTDKDNRIAEVDSVKITSAKFPGVEDQAQLDRLLGEVEAAVPQWDMQISLDALVATIKNDNTNKDAVQYRNDPPKIYYRNRPTTLIILDGEPKVQRDKDLDADRVVNTPSLIFKEGSQWNMYTGGIWYKSAAIKDGWTPNNQLSKKLTAVNEQVKKQEKENNGGKEPTEKPEATDILVSTEPAELLQTKGEPNYSNVQGTSLLYASNTSDELFKDINSQKTYTLLSGRWYAASSVEGPWTYIPADQLPPDFAKIPEGSDKDDVLSSVAGTPAAQEAKIEAEIPQTAKVDRMTASLTVSYDGSPRFKSIEGTSLKLAENSNVTVMQDASGSYFALENGIWFISNGPNGPWEVANARPKDVDNIPANSSAYNTKYVYIYETTPQYVYVGYTPGYMGCYIYGPTIIYGTGFYYSPWHGSIYYPRPVTWGFSFSYNPWTGWSMGYGYNTGFMYVGFHFGASYGYGGWFGPPMYRPPYRPYYGGGYYGQGGPRPYRGNVTINNNITINNNRNNIYRNHKGVTTITNRPGNTYNNRPWTKSAPGPGTSPGAPAVRPAVGGNTPGNNNRLPANKPSFQQRPSKETNNVFVDRSGNVFQKDKQGSWNQRDNQTKNWKPVQKDNPSIGTLNRESQMRDRGNMRTNNFNQQRAAPRPAPSNSGANRKR